MTIRTTVLTDFYPEALLLAADPAVINAILENVMAGARAYWIKLANERLSSSRRDYLDGLQEVEVGNGVASVALVGGLAHMVEEGVSAFDMHETLLGPNVPVVPVGQRGKHRGADGKLWRVIPFRHQTPGTAGLGGGQAMGSAYAGVVEDSAALGKEIHRAAKNLAASMTSPGGKTQWGGRLPPGMAPKLKPHHTTDIYAGMVRQQKTYAKATQNTYTTFRVIKEGDGKWLHPGIEPMHIADDVQQYVERVAPAAFAEVLGGAL